MLQRKIIHLDMDCFFAAVEIKYRPELRGKPVAVGGPAHSRSVLCTANYEARKFKVRSAMPTSMALRLCPELILLPVNFDLYRKESLAVREILERFTPLIEPLSLDEAYLDVTDSPHFQGSATLLAQEIRRLIFTERNLTASAGVSSNKFLAKVASDWRKPNGLFVIRPDEIKNFVKSLPVEALFGVGKVTSCRMHELGLKTCGDIQEQSVWKMKSWFGSRGLFLWELAHGIDHRPVECHSERKSLTVEETFDQDLSHLSKWLEKTPELYKDWEQRMQKSNYAERIRGLIVKVKYFNFSTTTHEMSFHQWPQLKDFQSLLTQVWNRRPEPCRLLGLGVRLQAEESEESFQQLSFLK